MKEIEDTTFNGGDNDEEEQMVVSCSSSTYFTPSESDEEMKKVEEKVWQLIVSVVRDPGLKEWQGKGENNEVPSSDRKGKRVEDMEHEGNIQENGEEVNQMEEAMVKEGDGTRQRGRTREGGDRRERKSVVSHVTFEWSGKVDKDEVDSILQQEVAAFQKQWQVLDVTDQEEQKQMGVGGNLSQVQNGADNYPEGKAEDEDQEEQVNPIKTIHLLLDNSKM